MDTSDNLPKKLLSDGPFPDQKKISLFEKQAWEAISSGFSFDTLLFSILLEYLILNTY